MEQVKTKIRIKKIVLESVTSWRKLPATIWLLLPLWPSALFGTCWHQATVTECHVQCRPTLCFHDMVNPQACLIKMETAEISASQVCLVTHGYYQMFHVYERWNLSWQLMRMKLLGQLFNYNHFPHFSHSFSRS